MGSLRPLAHSDLVQRLLGLRSRFSSLALHACNRMSIQLRPGTRVSWSPCTEVPGWRCRGSQPCGAQCQFWEQRRGVFGYYLLEWHHPRRERSRSGHTLASAEPCEFHLGTSIFETRSQLSKKCGGSYVSELDLVLVLVDGAWGALGDVFLNGKLSEEDLGLIVSLSLFESVDWGSSFITKWQFTE